MWDEIIHQVSNLKVCTVEVWERISNLIPHLTGHVITLTWWDYVIYQKQYVNKCRWSLITRHNTIYGKLRNSQSIARNRMLRYGRNENISLQFEGRYYEISFYITHFHVTFLVPEWKFIDHLTLIMFLWEFTIKQYPLMEWVFFKLTIK